MSDSKEKDLQSIQDLTYEQQKLAGELQTILINTKKLKFDLRTDQRCSEAWDKTKVKWHSFLSNHEMLKVAAPERDISYFQNDKLNVTKKIVIAIQDVLKKMDPVGSYEVPGETLIIVTENVVIPENPDEEVEMEEPNLIDGQNGQQQQMMGNGGPFNPQPSHQPPEVDWITRLVTGMNANNQEMIDQLQVQARNLVPDYGQGLKIPEIEVPLFDGNPRKFKCFSDTWKTIIETSNLGGLEKLALLKSRLIGRAAQATDHLDICNENYAEAWEILSERYDNARLLFEDEWTALLALPNLTGNNPDGILQMMESVKNIFANIRSMGIDPYSGPSFAAVTIINKFDKVTRNKFEEHLIDPRAVVSMTTVQDFLKRRYLEVLAQRNFEGQRNYQGQAPRSQDSKGNHLSITPRGGQRGGTFNVHATVEDF